MEFWVPPDGATYVMGQDGIAERQLNNINLIGGATRAFPAYPGAWCEVVSSLSGRSRRRRDPRWA